MFNQQFAGRRVLVTGHTGFKGSWLSLWLRTLGAEVSGYALDPASPLDLFSEVAGHAVSCDTRGDLRDLQKLRDCIATLQPEFIFHLAAQALVRRSYKDPLETFSVNALGTAHLLEAVRESGRACIVIVVTSDKCYENREWDFAYREDDPLGGHDIYSMSKAATELVAQAWRRSFFAREGGCVHIATVRAGNVLGGGDYAEDRIVPDSIRSLERGEAITVRNPGATRPWQHVLEPLSGYLWLAAELSAGRHGELSCAFNFGPGPESNRSVGELVQEIVKSWPGGVTHLEQSEQLHEASRLNLAIDKAVARLKWAPVWKFAETVERTVAWYYARHVTKSINMLDFTLGQIEAYAQAASARHICWATSPK